MKNTGTLVGAPIRPADSEDTYPVAFLSEIKGGRFKVFNRTALYELALAKPDYFEAQVSIAVIVGENGLELKLVDETKKHLAEGWVSHYNGTKTYADFGNVGTSSNTTIANLLGPLQLGNNQTGSFLFVKGPGAGFSDAPEGFQDRRACMIIKLNQIPGFILGKFYHLDANGDPIPNESLFHTHFKSGIPLTWHEMGGASSFGELEGDPRDNADLADEFEAIEASLATKVTQVGTKVLSDENYSTAEKQKLAAIDAAHYGAPLQSLSQLTALTGYVDKERRYVEDEKSDYFYDAQATSGDVAPADQTGGVGFWRKVAVDGETPASIKTKYESNPDTNAFTDVEKSKVANLPSDTNQVLEDLEAEKLTGTIAIDEEIVIEEVSTEDNKVISRKGIVEWWNKIKGSNQTFAERWDFDSGITAQSFLATLSFGFINPATKAILASIVSLATGTAKTYTFPDKNITVAGLDDLADKADNILSGYSKPGDEVEDLDVTNGDTVQAALAKVEKKTDDNVSAVADAISQVSQISQDNITLKIYKFSRYH